MTMIPRHRHLFPIFPEVGRASPTWAGSPPGTAEAVPALTPPADVAADRRERRAALLSVLEHRGPALAVPPTFRELRRQAVVLSGATGGAAGVFTLDGELPSLRHRYGRHRFGQALLLDRRPAEAGVPMIAVHFNEMTVCDGWDTHAKTGG